MPRPPSPSVGDSIRPSLGFQRLGFNSNNTHNGRNKSEHMTEAQPASPHSAMPSEVTPPSPRTALIEAIDLVNAGKIGEAMERCRDALRQNASDVNMTALLGALLLKSRETDLAETYLRRAVELAPDFAKPQEDLGFLLAESGRLEEAAPLLENATRLDPKSEQGFMALGRALSGLGRGDEADKAFEAGFELNPLRKKLAYAAEHHKRGRLEDAEKAYREVLEVKPNQIDAIRFLAGIVASRDQVEEAELLLRRALKLAPDFTLAYMDLGNLLSEQHRHTEALSCFQKARDLEPNMPRPQFMLASTLAQCGKTIEASAAYRRVLELRSDHAGAWLGLGHNLKTLGQQSEAIEAYRQCIETRPDNGEVYWSLANLKTYMLSPTDIEEMKASLDKESISEQSAVNFLFALAKAHEDQGDFDAAWDFYARGNTRQRAQEHYDPVETEVTNDELIEVFNADFLKDIGGVGHPDPAPIFVLGLPRSGSTLIEQILASHSMVEGTSELPYIGRVATSLNRNRADGINYPFSVRELKAANFDALGRDYLERASIHRQSERPRFIDKMPNNFPSVGFIHLILPNAKIIDARRYPLDATLSCYRQLFAKGQSFVYDLTDIGEYFVQYQRMMDHWHQVLPGKVLTLQYEELVMDLETQVRRLLDHCELPFEESCLRFWETDRPVRTASSEQVRQPIFTDSIHRWRNYARHISELVEVLEPVLPRYAKYESINK